MITLKFELVETHPNPDSVVVWLHGLGASGDDFVPIVPELNLPSDYKVRFIFPHAPSIPVTINGGVVMPAWYDILSMSIEREIDVDQIMASSKAIHKIIDIEIEKGTEPSRIIIAGFSQGGAVAYESALSYPKTLAGLMNMSTYYATEKTSVLNESNKKIPIFISHGKQDEVVPEVLGLQARDTLTRLGYDVDYKNYMMPHSVCAEQITDISRFIQRCLNE